MIYKMRHCLLLFLQPSTQPRPTNLGPNYVLFTHTMYFNKVITTIAFALPFLPAVSADLTAYGICQTGDYHLSS